MARIKKKRFRTPQEKYREHKRIGKLVAIFLGIAIVLLIIRDRQRIQWWFESWL